MSTGPSLFGTPSAEKLASTWMARYSPDISSLSLEKNPAIRFQLREASLAEGRANTIAKLHQNLVEAHCYLAAVRARDLYSHYDASSFEEVTLIAKLNSRIYLKLLEVYASDASIVVSSKDSLWQTVGDSSLEAWGIPRIETLASAIEPLMQELQHKFSVAKRWESIGFLTTQLMMGNDLLLQELTAAEQVLISPYFTFVEEQAALPWQRLCLAAAKHPETSPIFKVVNRLLPMATEISAAVYDRWAEAFPGYRSSRGSLSSAEIRHSSVRDFDMFQA